MHLFIPSTRSWDGWQRGMKKTWDGWQRGAVAAIATVGGGS
jgi:hypothetical protein